MRRRSHGRDTRKSRAQAKSFSSIGLSAFDNFTLTGNGDPEQLNGLRVSATFLPTLGILPALGRNFTAAEDLPNGPAVCIISHELWQTRFGGRAAHRRRHDHAERRSRGRSSASCRRGLSAPFSQVQVFAPRVFEVSGLTPVQVQNGAGYAQPIARLRPGVSLAQAAGELAALDRGYHERFATRLDANNTTEPRMFVDALVGNLQPTFYTLLGAVSFVLLIACANVASLFLSRLTARQKEIAVRQAHRRDARRSRPAVPRREPRVLAASPARSACCSRCGRSPAMQSIVALAAAAGHGAHAELARARVHRRA